MNRGYNFCRKGTTAFPEAWIISAIVPIEKDLSATELVSFCNRIKTFCTLMLYLFIWESGKIKPNWSAQAGM